MLPSIDFNRPDAGQAFVDSLQTFGFAAIDNHPLDTALVDRIYREWSAFFDSGNADSFAMSKETQDGYFSPEVAESAKGYDEQDYKEYYQFYTWGRCPESLAAVTQAYFDAAQQLASLLLEWVEAYSPDSVTFSEPLSGMIVDSEQTMLRILRYPGVDGSKPVLRAAPHEDINLLTVLPASDAPGLEIMGKGGEWIPVESRANRIVINIGDMLQEASGGFFPSTTHQVSTPAGDAGARMSLPLFLHPRPDVVLSARYTAGTYLQERLDDLGVS